MIDNGNNLFMSTFLFVKFFLSVAVFNLQNVLPLINSTKLEVTDFLNQYIENYLEYYQRPTRPNVPGLEYCP